MIERFSCYEFEINPYEDENVTDKWTYVIYDPDFTPTAETIIRHSQEWFDSDFLAKCAAIGHISMLEDGEG